MRRSESLKIHHTVITTAGRAPALSRPAATAVAVLPLPLAAPPNRFGEPNPEGARGDRERTASDRGHYRLETWQKLASTAPTLTRPPSGCISWGRRVEPLTAADAVTAPKLWARSRSAGRSLGGRCCLALGARLQLPTATSDTALGRPQENITVQALR
jgi:hypothetical protein